VCGIFGVVGVRDPQPYLYKMMASLAHRGPDNRGIWQGAGVALGHTRLSIVDLSSAGNQPMCNEDKTVWLVANGEIYNSEDLRAAVERRGHRLRSRSDSEVLLHLYEDHGAEFLPSLNGMIAFAIWDVQRRRLLLARDRMGIKPLYYHLNNGRLIFASEIKALLVVPELPNHLDPIGLKQYLTFQNTFGPTTFYKAVRIVEPGQYLVWENGSTRTAYFWEPQFTDQDNRTTMEQACRRYVEVAQRSVKRHLMSDVPVASYLSSGFDSTTVATLASEMLDSLSTFTGYFGTRGWYDETSGATAVSNRISSNHLQVLTGPDDLRNVMDELVYALDEPRMGMGAFSQFMVAREAAKKVRVILTGHGGDELFGGYPVFKLVRLFQLLRRDHLAGLVNLTRVRAAEWPHLGYFWFQGFRGGESGAFLPVLFPESMLERGLQPNVRRLLASLRPHEQLESLLKGESDPYRRLTIIYLRAYLPGLFVVEDKISMAHGLESRIPLCDNEMVELALGWPLCLKLHGDELKAVPKAAMRPFLPQILYRLPKRGFPTPLGHWLRGELNDWVRERLLGSGCRLEQLFRPEFLHGLVECYLASWRRKFRPLDEIQTQRMWALLSLEAFLRVTEERLGRKLHLS